MRRRRIGLAPLSNTALASTFVAALELARKGAVAIVQTALFGPIHLNGRRSLHS